jgi:hypothetical protein
MTNLPIFEELVASEAALRADYIYRNKRFTFNEGGVPMVYDATNPDSGASREEVAAHLHENYIRTYNFMFKDSSQHEKLVESKVCNTRDLSDDDRLALQQVFTDFVNRNYDEDGKPSINETQAPKAVVQLYNDLTSKVPLHHASMALGSLLVELGRGEKWRAVTPRGIDFTRGELSPNLLQRVSDAMYSDNFQPPTSEFIPFPESMMEIAGIKFPVKKDIEGWRIHLVTETGHLVDLSNDLKRKIEEHVASGLPMDDLKVDVGPSSFHLWQFQQPLSAGNQKAKQIRQQVRAKLDEMSVADHVDGMPIQGSPDQNRQVALVSLDVDLMTGLKIKLPKQESELKRFKSFLAKQGYTELSDLLPKDFTENIAFMPDDISRHRARMQLRAHIAEKVADLKAKAEGDESLQALIDRAGKKLENTLPHVYEITDKAFIDADTGDLRKPVAEGTKPKMYLAMGGTASGKGGLKTLAQKECGKDLVIASLDDARGDSDRYWLYLALNNHNDDYKSVEEFAKAIREITTQRAQKQHYNLFIDGSGVPYENRNDKVTRKFKENGYSVSVLAAQAPLFVYDPDKRNEMFSSGRLYNDATYRLGERLQNELRAVPMEVVIDKHVGFGLASRNAARDINVDRFMIQDVSVPMDQTYTLSYVLTLKKDDVRAIAELQGEELKKALVEKNLVPEWVKLPEGDERAKHFDLKVIRDNHDSTYRIEVITDIRQYVNMVQKGLLRRDAKGPEALFDNRCHSDIEGHFKAPGGKLRLQSPQGIVDAQWPAFEPLSKPSSPVVTGIGRV